MTKKELTIKYRCVYVVCATTEVHYFYSDCMLLLAKISRLFKGHLLDLFLVLFFIFTHECHRSVGNTDHGPWGCPSPLGSVSTEPAPWSLPQTWSFLLFPFLPRDGLGLSNGEASVCEGEHPPLGQQGGTVDTALGLESGRLMLKSGLRYFLAVWPLAGHYNSLCLSFLVCKMGIAPLLQGCWED